MDLRTPIMLVNKHKSVNTYLNVFEKKMLSVEKKGKYN